MSYKQNCPECGKKCSAAYVHCPFCEASLMEER